MSNKVNAAARSFCFLLIRTKSTLGMQGIFDFYTLSYFKARDLWGESFTFFLGWHSPRQATLWPGLSLSWNKTFSTSSPPFHRAAASFHLWLTAPKPPVRQTLSPSLICQALQNKAQLLVLLYILVGCICGTEIARDRHSCVSFPRRLQYCHHLGQKIA